MSLLQTFPIMNRPPRRQRIFCPPGFCLFAIASVKFYGSLLGPAYAAVACAVLVPAPSEVAVHRHPRSPSGDAARRPAFVPPPPPLASSHSFLRTRKIAARTAVSRCPVRRLPTCIANSPPATVVTSDLRSYGFLTGVDCPPNPAASAPVPGTAPPRDCCRNVADRVDKHRYRTLDLCGDARIPRKMVRQIAIRACS